MDDGWRMEDEVGLRCDLMAVAHCCFSLPGLLRVRPDAWAAVGKLASRPGQNKGPALR